MGIWNVRPRIYSGLDVVSQLPERTSCPVPELAHSPEVKVLEALPQKPERDGFAIVHAALGWVFPQDPVHYDLLLAEGTRVWSASFSMFGSRHEGPYRSLNHPFLPRNQLAVWLGPAGINTKEKSPMTSVKRPCPHGQPGHLRVVATAVRRSGAYLDQEQPPPARDTMDTPHVQDPEREEGRGDVGDTHGRPKETQSEGQLMVLVKVREVQDHLFDCVSFR